MKVGGSSTIHESQANKLLEGANFVDARGATFSFNVVREAIYNLNLNIKIVVYMPHHFIVHATIGYCIIILWR